MIQQHPNKFLQCYLVLLLFIFTFCIYGVNGSCPNDCSGHGYCSSNQCVCDKGYYQSDCSEYMKESQPTGMKITQALISFMYSLVFLFGVITFVSSKISQSLTVVSNVRSYVFVAIGFVGLLHAIYAAVDPFSVYGIMPPIANSLISQVHYAVGISVLILILFHWIEVVNLSLQTLKKENMLKKINVNYKGKEITVEDMVEQVKFLKKLKIPFIVAICFIYVAVISLVALDEALNQPILGGLMILIVVIYYIGLTVGFFVYRRKMIQIMPYELTKKVKKLTFRVTALSVYILVSILIVIPIIVAFPPASAAGALVSFAILHTDIAVLCFFMIGVFVSWSSKFPWISFATNKTQTSGHSTVRSLQRTATNDTETDLVSISDMPLSA